ASLEALAGAIESLDGACATAGAAAVYLYPTVDRIASERALRQLEGWTSASLQPAGTGPARLTVSTDLGELDGPMAGVTIISKTQAHDCVLVNQATSSAFLPLVSANDAPVFVRFERSKKPIFLCTSAVAVDIDKPITAGYFDIKPYFCSLVPFVMFTL